MIFYKVVKYKLSIPPPHERIDHYFAVIIIHNDPTPDAGAQRICEEKNRVKGWEDIENTDSVSGLIYVCEFNKDVAFKLNLLGKDNFEDKNPLRLDRLPIYHAEQKMYSYEDKIFDIRDKIKELFGNKED